MIKIIGAFMREEFNTSAKLFVDCKIFCNKTKSAKKKTYRTSIAIGTKIRFSKIPLDHLLNHLITKLLFI